MDKLRKQNEGVTLIALVITIIILLILAGVVLNLSLGENGILKLAEKAGKDYQNASEYEKSILNEYDNFINVATTGITTKENEKSYEIIYVGELNEIKGDYGIVTTSFDIKTIYEDYKNLTIDNFVYQISKMYDHWGTNVNRINNTLSKSYNPETGILTINNAYQVASFNSGIRGKVYLIPNIEQIN